MGARKRVARRSADGGSRAGGGGKRARSRKRVKASRAADRFPRLPDAAARRVQGARGEEVSRAAGCTSKLRAAARKPTANDSALGKQSLAPGRRAKLIEHGLRARGHGGARCVCAAS
eukprot:1752540-Pyramimonas_sp.AAC.1